MKLGAACPGGELTLLRLTEAYLDAAAELCDRCVGKNLYPREFLASLLEKPDHYFDLLVTPEGDVAGYFYFFLTGLSEMAAFSKLPLETLAAAIPEEAPVIANLQSIGVAGPYRRRGLSAELMRYGLAYLKTHTAAAAAVGVGWKIGGYVPIEKTLNAFGFRYLADAHRVWYDRDDLVCPYCEGRCTCDASVYYKPLERGP